MSTVTIRPCYNVTSALLYQYGDDHQRCAALQTDLGGADAFLRAAQQSARAHKDRRVQAYTLVQSWPTDDLRIDNPDDVQRANDLGVELAHTLYPGAAVSVTTHIDGKGGKVHNHITVINDQDGHAIRQNRQWRVIKHINDDLMRDNAMTTANQYKRDRVQSNRARHAELDGKPLRYDALADLQRRIDNALDQRPRDFETFASLLDEQNITVHLRHIKKDDSYRISYKLTCGDDGKSHNPARGQNVGALYTYDAIMARIKQFEDEYEQDQQQERKKGNIMPLHFTRYEKEQSVKTGLVQQQSHTDMWYDTDVYQPAMKMIDSGKADDAMDDKDAFERLTDPVQRKSAVNVASRRYDAAQTLLASALRLMYQNRDNGLGPLVAGAIVATSLMVWSHDDKNWAVPHEYETRESYDERMRDELERRYGGIETPTTAQLYDDAKGHNLCSTEYLIEHIHRDAVDDGQQARDKAWDAMRKQATQPARDVYPTQGLEHTL